jgi:hypothetical protein
MLYRARYSLAGLAETSRASREETMQQLRGAKK